MTFKQFTSMNYNLHIFFYQKTFFDFYQIIVDPVQFCVLELIICRTTTKTFLEKVFWRHDNHLRLDLHLTERMLTNKLMFCEVLNKKCV